MINRIGMQLYTLRDLCKTPADIAKTLKAVKEIGYPAVQVSGIGPIEPAELKKITDDLGLVIAASHTSYNELKNELPKFIETHKIWECSHSAIGMLPQESRGNAEGYVKFAKECSEIGEKLSAEGITLSYHNHAVEFQKFDGKIGLEWIYSNSDPKFFQAELDTYWIQYGGGDVEFWCRKMKGRLPHLHLKDYGIIDNKPTFMEVGEGNLNWPKIIEAAKDAGTKWYLVEQDICPGDPLESAKISYDNLKKMLS